MKEEEWERWRENWGGWEERVSYGWIEYNSLWRNQSLGWKRGNVGRRVDWDEGMIPLLWIDSRGKQCNGMMSSSSEIDLGGEGGSEDFNHSLQFESRKRNHSIYYSLKIRQFSLSLPFDWY